MHVRHGLGLNLPLLQGSSLSDIIQHVKTFVPRGRCNPYCFDFR
jgi:hypothetical protein